MKQYVQDVVDEIAEEIEKFNPHHDAKVRFTNKQGNTTELGTASHGKSGKSLNSGKRRLEAYAKKRGWTPDQGDISEWHKKQQANESAKPKTEKTTIGSVSEVPKSKEIRNDAKLRREATDMLAKTQRELKASLKDEKGDAKLENKSRADAMSKIRQAVLTETQGADGPSLSKINALGKSMGFPGFKSPYKNLDKAINAISADLHEKYYDKPHDAYRAAKVSKKIKKADSMKKGPDTFMSMCMHHEVTEKGTPQDQAVAICMSMQKKWGTKAEGWTRYKAVKKAEDDRRARQVAASAIVSVTDEDADGTLITLQSP